MSAVNLLAIPAIPAFVRRLVRLGCFGSVLVMSPLVESAAAQTADRSVSGHVEDPSGGAISGARLVVTCGPAEGGSDCRSSGGPPRRRVRRRGQLRHPRTAGGPLLARRAHRSLHAAHVRGRSHVARFGVPARRHDARRHPERSHRDRRPRRTGTHVRRPRARVGDDARGDRRAPAPDPVAGAARRARHPRPADDHGPGLPLHPRLQRPAHRLSRRRHPLQRVDRARRRDAVSRLDQSGRRAAPRSGARPLVRAVRQRRARRHRQRDQRAPVDRPPPQRNRRSRRRDVRQRRSQRPRRSVTDRADAAAVAARRRIRAQDRRPAARRRHRFALVAHALPRPAVRRALHAHARHRLLAGRRLRRRNASARQLRRRRYQKRDRSAHDRHRLQLQRDRASTCTSSSTTSAATTASSAATGSIAARSIRSGSTSAICATTARRPARSTRCRGRFRSTGRKTIASNRRCPPRSATPRTPP